MFLIIAEIRHDFFYPLVGLRWRGVVHIPDAVPARVIRYLPRNIREVAKRWGRMRGGSAMLEGRTSMESL